MNSLERLFYDLATLVNDGGFFVFLRHNKGYVSDAPAYDKVILPTSTPGAGSAAATPTPSPL